MLRNMQNLQTKNRILTLFEGGNQAYERVSKEEYRQLYFSVQSEIGKDGKKLNLAIGEFLLHGAMKYNRFIGLRPQSVDEEYYDMFCNFLDSLQKFDGTFQDVHISSIWIGLSGICTEIVVCCHTMKR